jgi:hypothetical protein
MTAIFKGSTAIQLQSLERNWTRERGWSSVYTYLGEWSLIDAAKTNTLYTDYASNIQATQDKNLGTLKVTFANTDSSEPDQNTEDSNTWTFQPYTIQRNIEEHPNYVGLADIANENGFLQRILLAVESYKSKVSTGISAGDADKDLVFDLDEYIVYKNADNANITAANEALAEELAGLVIRGHTTYDVTKYTLRNVKVVPANTNLTIDHLKTSNQWSTFRVVDLILSGPPTVTQSSIIGDVFNTFLEDKWLKQAPAIHERTDGKFEITTEFLNIGADELPTQIYPNYL